MTNQEISNTAREYITIFNQVYSGFEQSTSQISASVVLSKDPNEIRLCKILEDMASRNIITKLKSSHHLSARDEDCWEVSDETYDNGKVNYYLMQIFPRIPEKGSLKDIN